ncbi:LPS export ABC transporter permease LptG [Xylella fastidiosa]|uniref:LPS export ABC transporter permease LptG n=1 Tax=Xylella fastidiosa TaxID=2371 RepID=UPI0019D425BC|nr:LPS export ABC transporter permease LptG [Xylella fastidiosa]
MVVCPRWLLDAVAAEKPMKLFPCLHDRYVARAVVATVLLTWLVLLSLDVVNGFASEVRDIGKGSYSFGHAIAYIAYTAPRRAYTLFPTAAVIGMLLGLGQLAATSELTALRALGVSRKRLSLSVMMVIGMGTGLMALTGETLGPWAQAQADILKASAKYKSDMTGARYSGFWAREGEVFLNARSGEEKRLDSGGIMLILHDVRLYQLAADGRLQSMTRAARVEHHQDVWILQQVQRDTFSERGVQRETFHSLPWRSRLDPAALAAGLAKPRNLSVHELVQSIEYRRRNHLDARDFEGQYWSRWFYPINVLALCLAAIPFSFGLLRSGGMGKRTFLGILFALSFWMLQMFFERIASVLKLNYQIFYLLPPMVMLCGSYWLFRRQHR